MAVFRTQISCIAIWLVQVSAHTSPWEWIARVWCFPVLILCLYPRQCQLYWRDMYCTHPDFLRSIAASISECCQYWKWEGKIYRGEDGWRGKWCRSLDIAKESWDQGCLYSAFGGAPCIAPRNPCFPGTADHCHSIVFITAAAPGLQDIVWQNVYHPWASKALAMPDKHHRLGAPGNIPILLCL